MTAERVLPEVGRREVFQLASRTPPRWAPAVASDVPALLSDHAHLELKAAASAMTLLKRQAGRPGFALRLAPLVREEAEHLQRVLRELSMRGWPLLPDRPSPYAAGLLAAAGAPRRREAGLLDSLLVAALIELRSHERFECLVACPALAELRPLYEGLAEAEARHGELFLELALEIAPETAIRARFLELAGAEAALLESLPCEPRLHSGPG
ncbi:MAG: tRNA isopentenyl-2-thiomethyl-A-37 hydroxylase MiaE [Planctomycetota bacterium]